MRNGPVGPGVGKPLADDDATADAEAKLEGASDDDAAAGLDDAVAGALTGDEDGGVADADAGPCVIAGFEGDDVHPARSSADSSAEPPTTARVGIPIGLDIPVNIAPPQEPGTSASEGRILRGERSRYALVRVGNGRQR